MNRSLAWAWPARRGACARTRGRGVRPPSPDCVGVITATGANSIQPSVAFARARVGLRRLARFPICYQIAPATLVAGARNNGKAPKCGGFPMERTGIEPVTPCLQSGKARAVVTPGNPHGYWGRGPLAQFSVSARFGPIRGDPGGFRHSKRVCAQMHGVRPGVRAIGKSVGLGHAHARDGSDVATRRST